MRPLASMFARHIPEVPTFKGQFFYGFFFSLRNRFINYQIHWQVTPFDLQ
jgi:hypothetical protein